MSEPYLGQIMMCGFDFPPKGWATCDGQVLSIQQNQALFSLLGVVYGGNGTTTFALPDLRGRAGMHWGDGPGLSPRDWGEVGGRESVKLTSAQLPAHTHALAASSQPSTDRVVQPGKSLASDAGFAGANPNAALAAQTIASSGGGQPHENMQPYLVINYCIAIVGIYPSRN